jgi:hypothetical protein
VRACAWSVSDTLQSGRGGKRKGAPHEEGPITHY